LDAGIVLQRKDKNSLSPGCSNENQIVGLWEIFGISQVLAGSDFRQLLRSTVRAIISQEGIEQ
jgi:hypothetical protein